MNRTDPDDAVTLSPVTFTPEQAAAVVMALATQPEGPYAADGRAALGIVLDALDPERRERATRLAERVRAGAGGARVPGVRDAVEEALAQRRVLVVDYRDSTGRTTRRRIEPQALVRTGEHEYLVAWCLERGAVRWFLQGRVVTAVLTQDAAADREPALFGALPPWAGRARPPRSAAHPAGRARRAGPTAQPAAGRAEPGLAPVIHLRSAR